jgi:hypothetical protein
MSSFEMKANNDNDPFLREGERVTFMKEWLTDAVASKIGPAPFVIARVVTRGAGQNAQVLGYLVAHTNYTKGMYIPDEDEGEFNGVRYVSVPLLELRVVPPSSTTPDDTA